MMMITNRSIALRSSQEKREKMNCGMKKKTRPTEEKKIVLSKRGANDKWPRMRSLKSEKTLKLGANLSLITI